MATTEKQKAANRENAALSCGPKTEEGKMISSMNSLKHGIFAKELIITKGDGRENVDDFNLLITELIGDLKPEGRLEMLLVEKIAVNYWRLRRLIRYEAGQIRFKIDDYKKEIVDAYYKQFDDDDLSRKKNTEKPIKPPVEFIKNEIKVTEAEIIEQEHMLESIINNEFDLSDHIDFIQFVLTYQSDNSSKSYHLNNDEQAKDYVKNLSKQVLGKLKASYIEQMKNKIKLMREIFEWQNVFEIRGRLMNIPDNIIIITKYENSLERSIFRNLSLLRELQKNRQE